MSHPFEPSVRSADRSPRVTRFTRFRRALGATVARVRALTAEDLGQTTAEYALVLLGAAGVAMLLLGWATQSNAIDTLFNSVLDGVVGRVK